MRRLVVLAVAGFFDTIGSAASAFGDYCLASCEAIVSVLEEGDKERRRKARNEAQMNKARRAIESLPVVER